MGEEAGRIFQQEELSQVGAKAEHTPEGYG